MCHIDSPIFPISGGDHLTEADLTIDVLDTTPLPLFVVTPETTPAPAILLIADIYGPSAFYRDIARRLAAAGYLVALPDLFARLEPLDDPSRDELRARNGQLEQVDSLRDVQHVLTWLKHHEASTGKLGTIGFCMGGTLVMLAGSRQPVPNASVAFYGFPTRQRTPTNPILASDVDEAANLASPLLAFWGDEDRAISVDTITAYDTQLTELGKPHEFTVYPGVGHSFMTFDPDAPTSPAATAAWTRTLAFLEEHLA